MSREIGVLVIHGMGSQRRGFSNDFVEEVSDRLDNEANAVAWQEVYWANALKQRQDTLWECMRTAKEPDGSKIPLDSKSAREFVVQYFGDAVAYQRDCVEVANAYKAIHSIVSANLVEIKGNTPAGTPIVVIAHSLGGHIMSSYIWDRQHPRQQPDTFEPIETLAGIVTFGCNIPLFSLAFPVAKPIDLPGSAVSEPVKAVTKWLNFLDRDDILGWPLKTLYEKNLPDLSVEQQETVARIEDYEINVGSALTSWNWISHADYWTDNDFTRPVARYLRTLIETT